MSTEPGSRTRVAVVGAGLSGLRAAWQLARLGFDVEVYEAREQIGGRAGGQWQSGHWMDSRALHRTLPCGAIGSNGRH